MYKFAISQGWLFRSANILSLAAFSVRYRAEYDYAQDALKLSSWDFFQEHAEAWRETWKNGLLEVMLLGQLFDQLINQSADMWQPKRWITQSHGL